MHEHVGESGAAIDALGSSESGITVFPIYYVTERKRFVCVMDTCSALNNQIVRLKETAIDTAALHAVLSPPEGVTMDAFKTAQRVIDLDLAYTFCAVLDNTRQTVNTAHHVVQRYLQSLVHAVEWHRIGKELIYVVFYVCVLETPEMLELARFYVPTLVEFLARNGIRAHVAETVLPMRYMNDVNAPCPRAIHLSDRAVRALPAPLLGNKQNVRSFEPESDDDDGLDQPKMSRVGSTPSALYNPRAPSAPVGPRAPRASRASMEI